MYISKSVLQSRLVNPKISHSCSKVNASTNKSNGTGGSRSVVMGNGFNWGTIKFSYARSSLGHQDAVDVLQPEQRCSIVSHPLERFQCHICPPTAFLHTFPGKSHMCYLFAVCTNQFTPPLFDLVRIELHGLEQINQQPPLTYPSWINSWWHCLLAWCSTFLSLFSRSPLGLLDVLWKNYGFFQFWTVILYHNSISFTNVNQTQKTTKESEAYGTRWVTRGNTDTPGDLLPGGTPFYHRTRTQETQHG